MRSFYLMNARCRKVNAGSTNVTCRRQLPSKGKALLRCKRVPQPAHPFYILCFLIALFGFFLEPLRISIAMADPLCSALIGQKKAINVTAYGADPTGQNDSAPAFRAAVAAAGSNSVILVPPGTYSLASTTRAPCCSFVAQAVLVQNVKHVAIEGYGARLVLSPGLLQATAFRIDRSRDVCIEGLTLQGAIDRPNKETHVGLSISSVLQMTVNDIHFAGLMGTGIAGDWIVDGKFTNLTMDAVNQCLDIAYLRNVEIGSITGRGFNELTKTGSKCVSVVADPINHNYTGIDYPETKGVFVHDVSASGFAVGAYITSGVNFRFSHNYWHDNPGIANRAKGIGILISYIARGKYINEGFPVRNVVIDGDRFADNGMVTPGAAVWIDTRSVTNGDLLENITICNSVFSNNATLGVHVVSPEHLSGLSILGNNNRFGGPAQRRALGPNASRLSAASGTSDCSGRH
jgi:Pectate lyase superfamily protein